MLTFDEYYEICDLIEAEQDFIPELYGKNGEGFHRNPSKYDGKCLLLCAAINDFQEDEALFETIINQSDIETLNNLLPYFAEGSKTAHMILNRITLLEKFGNSQSKQARLTTTSDDKSFFPFLCQWIDKKGFKTDSEFYNQAGISRQAFSKLRNSKMVVSREMAFHLAAALCLNYEEANEFLSFAGYSFNPNSRREQIMSYYMRNKDYTFYELEEILSILHEKTFLEW